MRHEGEGVKVEGVKEAGKGQVGAEMGMAEGGRNVKGWRRQEGEGVKEAGSVSIRGGRKCKG